MHELVAPWRELVDDSIPVVVERALDRILDQGTQQAEVVVLTTVPESSPAALTYLLTKLTQWPDGCESILSFNGDHLLLVRSVASRDDYRNGRRFLRAVAHCAGVTVRAGLASTPEDGMTADVLVSTALRRLSCSCLRDTDRAVAARVCETDCDLLAAVPYMAGEHEDAMRGASGF